MFVAVQGDAPGPFFDFAVRQVLPQHGVEIAGVVGAGVSRLDGAFAQTRQGRFHRRTFAAPPGRQRWQLQRLAQQVARQGRQKTQQGGRLQKGRARRVGHQQVARADGLQQARHAQRGVAAQFQRIQKLIVHAFEKGVHRLQALEGFEEQALVAHDQVAAFDQGQAQVTRQVGVFEIGFVVGARRKQGDVRVHCGRQLLLDALHQGAVGASQALHRHALKGLGEQVRDGQAVFQQIAQAAGRLGALRHHPPMAVGPARQVERGDVQMGAAHRFHAVHGAQVAGVALHQGRGQQALLKQLLRPIDIGHDALQQAHALADAGLNLLPVLRLQNQREQVERPGALRAAFVGIDVVGNAVVADLPRQAGRAQFEPAQAV